MNADCCYKLYMHINKTNGKVYVGQTKKSYCRRWRNGKGYSTCSRFAKSIEKYGWDGFEHIPLIEGLSKSEADYFEQFFIEFFDSQNPEFGYNLTTGGDECPMDNPVVRENHREAMKKLSADPEWRKKHREALKKLHADPEYQKKNREAMKKVHADPEWRKKVSEANRKMAQDPEWRENVRKANQKLHADPEYQKKHREALKKLHADPEYQKKNREAMKKVHADPEWRKKQREGAKKICKKVLCVETKIVYGSLKEAAIAVNLKTSTPICLCCGGKQKTAAGYHWEHA